MTIYVRNIWWNIRTFYLTRRLSRSCTITCSGGQSGALILIVRYLGFNLHIAPLLRHFTFVIVRRTTRMTYPVSGPNIVLCDHSPAVLRGLRWRHKKTATCTAEDSPNPPSSISTRHAGPAATTEIGEYMVHHRTCFVNVLHNSRDNYLHLPFQVPSLQVSSPR